MADQTPLPTEPSVTKRPGCFRLALPAWLGIPFSRAPFTLALIATVLCVSALNGLLGHPIAAPQLNRWGFGWQDLVDGHFWRLLTAPLFILKPYMSLTISAIILFFVGSCELLLRTRRTLIVFAVSHVVGYVGALLLLNPLGRAGWGLAAELAAHRDVGASNGAFGAAGAMIIFMPPGLRTIGLFLCGGYLVGALFLEQQLWDVQHSIAFLSGVGLGSFFLRRDTHGLAGPRLSGDILHRQRPRLMSWFVGGMGLVNILAAILLPRHPGFERLEELLPLGLHHGPRMLLVFSGLLLMTVAGALSRSQRAAWWVAFLALLVTLGLQLQLGVNKIEAMFALAFLLLLAAWKEDFPAPVDPPSLRAARTKAALALLGVPLVSWLAALVLRFQYTGQPGTGEVFADVLRRLVYLPPLVLEPVTRRADWLLEAIPLVFWTSVVMLVALALRAARAPHPDKSEFARARQLAMAHGATGTSYMATWKGNHLFFEATDAAFLAYRVQGSVAVVLGDPVGPPAVRGQALKEFTEFCRGHGWMPVVLGATRAERAAYAACGFQLLQIGEEAVLDLGGLEFKGKKWQNMRTALNRAGKIGVEFRLYEGGRVPAVIEVQMRDLERTWQQQQMLPPLQFTQGQVDDTRDQAVEVAVAVGADGKLHGYVDWLPVPAGRGWVIDLMRRAPDSMNGTMEFLIGMSLLTFQERGDAFISLATAPLADLDRDATDSLVPQVLGQVFERFETFYDFRSLFDFKERFEPRWEPTYLAYGDAAELPNIAVAILRAHLPHLGWTQAVRLFGEVLSKRLNLKDNAADPPSPAPAPGTRGSWDT